MLVAHGLAVGCASQQRREAVQVPVATVPLFDGLGDHRWEISTRSSDAQRYFDQGIAFLYAFNHDEARRSFEQAAALDETCTMCAWGAAMTNGPHINFPVVPEDRAKHAAEWLARAKVAAEAAPPLERALVAALEQRYRWPQPADRKPLDEAYAAAMREVWKAHPSEVGVGALFAEAMMDLRPWDLWTSDGRPQPGTDEILATLDRVLELSPRHPLANHLYIHAVEASPDPGRATKAADVLRELQPGLGHMVHMPSHIDVRTGRWEQAIVANEKAMAADRDYRAQRPEQGFYRLYMAHNHHMSTFAAMMLGQRDRAMKTIREMVSGMPREWVLENVAFVDGYTGMPYEVMLRFGLWDEILAEPEPPPELPVARLLRRYGRGIALAVKGDVSAARAEQRAFVEGRAALAPGLTFGNNEVAALLDVAEKVLEGELLVQEGKRIDEGIEVLRAAVALEDRLRYDEPPDWIQPVRHALGAALLRASRAAEAERVYREDLARLPRNVWSLVGLARALRMQGREADALPVERMLAEASRDADVELTTSCLCLPGI
ncbi:hypothetical protein L6R52_01070 [Myxococcota bacterium]|nr:hypothetical protein [Myxococcota bacterium]